MKETFLYLFVLLQITFDCDNPIALAYITRLRLDLNLLSDRKFKHGFQDTLNLFCNYGSKVEMSIHHLLQYPVFRNETLSLLN